MPEIRSAKASASPSRRKANEIPSAGTQGITISGASPPATGATKLANQAAAAAASVAGINRQAPAPVATLASASAKDALPFWSKPPGAARTVPACRAAAPSYGLVKVNQPWARAPSPAPGRKGKRRAMRPQGRGDAARDRRHARRAACRRLRSHFLN